MVRQRGELSATVFGVTADDFSSDASGGGSEEARRLLFGRGGCLMGVSGNYPQKQIEKWACRLKREYLDKR
jgi:hypothetical protein